MAYNYTYNQNDLQNIVVDGIGTAGASFVQCTNLFILGMVMLILLGIYVKIRKAVKG